MKKQLTLLCAALSLVVMACGNVDEIVDNEIDKREGKLVDAFDDYKNSAMTTINNMSLVGTILTLDISYSGGCEKHAFELVALNSVGKSLPPVRSMMLYHDSNGDTCREFITEKLVFNVANFAHTDESGKKTVLKLDGYSETVTLINL